MMRWITCYRILLLLAVACLVLTPHPSEGQPDAGTSTMAKAVLDKFLQCYQAEGAAVTQEDQDTLVQFINQMSTGLGGALGGDCGATGPQAEQACAEAVKALKCDELAQELTGVLSKELGLSLTAFTEIQTPEPWADTYAGAITDKVLLCYSAELGSQPNQADLDKVAEFRLQLGRVLSILTTKNKCTVNTSKLTTCSAAIKGMDCSTMAKELDNNGGQLLQGLQQACDRFLDCGLDELEGAIAQPPTQSDL